MLTRALAGALLAGLLIGGVLPGSALAISSGRVAAPAGAAPRVTVSLVSDAVTIEPGSTFWIGLRQRIAPGWHTYWINPGDSGEPLSIEWSLPAGFTAGPIVWPGPERVPVPPFMSYGYTNEVVLPVQITAPANLDQTLQREAIAQGVVWLTLISSAKGEQGFVTPPQADELTATRKAAPTAVLLDDKGVVGHMYGATNTPHMYIVDKAGVLVYAGAIDDRPTTRRADVPGATNYVRAALEAVTAGQPAKTPVTRAYGCTVKYS